MTHQIDQIATVLPGELTCVECNEVFDRGYIPVGITDTSYDGFVDLAVCETCGWRDVGHMGCAPELRDFEAGELLVRVERADSRLEPVTILDEH